MEKTAYQKVLKVLCILGAVVNGLLAITNLGMAILALVGVADPSVASQLSPGISGDVNGTLLTTGQAVAAAAAIGIVMGVLFALNFLVCILGIRGANKPSKIKPFFYVVVALTVLQVISFVYTTMHGFSSNVLYSFLFNVVLIFLAYKVKQQA